MPTIELFTPPQHPDGSWSVMAPGGYEVWHFEAELSDRVTRLVTALHLGWQMHPRYIRAYARYRRKPTTVAPPVPAEYPGVTIELQENGETVAAIGNEVDPADVMTASDSLRVRVGASHVAGTSQGAIHLSVRGMRGNMTVAADLMFKPRVGVSHRWSPAAKHFVQLVEPLAEVEGQVQVFDTSKAAAPPRVIEIKGRGYREHRIGLRPLRDLDREVTIARRFSESEAAIAWSFGGGVHVLEVTEQSVRQCVGSMEEITRWNPRKLTSR